MSATDKAKNKAQEVAGKIRKNTGKATDDHDLAARGKTEQARGDVKQAGEKINDAFTK
jgi:uncharacterized protein YjbJ (UPF0337 family)